MDYPELRLYLVRKTKIDALGSVMKLQFCDLTRLERILTSPDKDKETIEECF